MVVPVLLANGIISAFADIPWRDVQMRLKRENARLANQGNGNRCFVICTLYYTPMESGFIAARGFDVRMETRPGLRGRKYPRDFLLAVKKEGSGRIKQPVEGCNYICYKGGRSYTSPTARRSRYRSVVARFSQPLTGTKTFA